VNVKQTWSTVRKLELSEGNRQYTIWLAKGDETAAIVYFDNLTTDPRREPSAEHPSFKTTAKNLTVYA
jgi:hypothetical protein